MEAARLHNGNDGRRSKRLSLNQERRYRHRHGNNGHRRNQGSSRYGACRRQFCHDSVGGRGRTAHIRQHKKVYTIPAFLKSERGYCNFRCHVVQLRYTQPDTPVVDKPDYRYVSRACARSRACGRKNYETSSKKLPRQYFRKSSRNRRCLSGDYGSGIDSCRLFYRL